MRDLEMQIDKQLLVHTSVSLQIYCNHVVYGVINIQKQNLMLCR